MWICSLVPFPQYILFCLSLTGEGLLKSDVKTGQSKEARLSRVRISIISVASLCNLCCTTGDHEFAVCPRHTAKNCKHTAKTSPTVADGSYRDGEALVCRVSKVAHTANLFAVCIYRRTAKKSEKTPSGLADGVGVCSPCVCTVDTRWTFRLRRVSLVLAHGKSVSFAVCLAYDARRIMVSSSCA